VVAIKLDDICIYRRCIVCVRLPHLMGNYTGRPSVIGFLLHRTGFNPMIVHVGFLVHTVAQEVIGFILPALIPPVHHTGMS
jgi:hypothetical protein